MTLGGRRTLSSDTLKPFLYVCARNSPPAKNGRASYGAAYKSNRISKFAAEEQMYEYVRRVSAASSRKRLRTK